MVPSTITGQWHYLLVTHRWLGDCYSIRRPDGSVSHWVRSEETARAYCEERNATAPGHDRARGEER